MPEIPVELAKQVPEPIEGRVYTIAAATMETTQVRAYKMCRVELKDEQGNTAIAILWLRSVASEKSKLGSFVQALGTQTDTWIGKRIEFIAWRQGNRQIKVVQ